jgi:rubredoxin
VRLVVISMSFQFQCPQGHLLEGDPSQAGQQCACPTCGTLFIIPAPVYAPSAAAPWAGPAGAQPTPWAPGAPAGPEASPQSPYAPAGAPQQPATPAAEEPKEPELLHIPCPNGHELETPLDMLDQDVLCPQCQAQFTLRRRDSIEYKKKKEEEDRRREAKASKLALNAAIVAAVLVALLLIGLLVMATLGRTPKGPPPKPKKTSAASAPTLPFSLRERSGVREA